MLLGLIVCDRTLVYDDRAFHGEFQSVPVKRSRHFNLQDALAVGIHQLHRKFKPMSAQIERWMFVVRICETSLARGPSYGLSFSSTLGFWFQRPRL